MRDGDVLEGNVELGSAEGEVVLDSSRNGFTLCDQLCGIELGDDGLQDFISDRRQDSLIVINTEVLHMEGLVEGRALASDNDVALCCGENRRLFIPGRFWAKLGHLADVAHAASG